MAQHLKRPGNWLAVSALVVATVGLEACTAWPGPATGGYAERRPTQWAALLSVQQRHDAAVRAGAQRFAAGRIVELRLLITRAQRENEGGLLADADVTLERADRLMSLIERDLGLARGGDRGRARSGA